MSESPLPANADKGDVSRRNANMLTVAANGRSLVVEFDTPAVPSAEGADEANKGTTTVADVLRQCASEGLIGEKQGIALRVGDRYLYPAETLTAFNLG